MNNVSPSPGFILVCNSHLNLNGLKQLMYKMIYLFHFHYHIAALQQLVCEHVDCIIHAVMLQKCSAG